MQIQGLAPMGSSFVPAIYYTSTTHGDAHHPGFSNPNGEHHLPQSVTNLKNALAQQTTLVNQLLERIEMQRAPDEVSRRRKNLTHSNDVLAKRRSTSQELSVRVV
ncbi:hypothetical protein ACFX13_013741 [Malus domestica]